MLRKHLIGSLTDAKKQIENYVIQGSLADFAAYRFFAGQIKGIQDAIDICNDIYKKGDDE